MELLISILFMIFLVILWQKGYKRYLLESYRHRLFRLRDELFYYAVDNNVEFESESYTIVRKQLNARIRFAHRYNFIQVFLFGISGEMKEIATQTKNNTSKIIQSGSSPETSKYFGDLLEKADLEAVKFLLKSTPILLLIIIPFALLKNSSEKGILKNTEEKLEPFWDLPMADSISEKQGEKFAIAA